MGDAGPGMTSFAVGTAGASTWVALSTTSQFVTRVEAPLATPSLIQAASQSGPYPGLAQALTTHRDPSGRERVGYLFDPAGYGGHALRDAVLLPTGWRVDTVVPPPVSMGAGTVDPAGSAHLITCSNGLITHVAR